MSSDPQPSDSNLGEIATLLGAPDEAALAKLGIVALLKRTQRQLAEASRLMGIGGVSRWSKDALAARLLAELPRLTAPQTGASTSNGKPNGQPKATAPTDVATRAPAELDDENESDPVLTHKFESGLHGAVGQEARTIPWSYGQNRVTAMPVDPDRLFVYWELTDEAIAQARPKLGAAGADAWINLRVYDTSGLIFDGTNAHGYFDHKVERHERQWFFHIGKPSSQTVIELGLRSHEGFFTKIARSGRVDFPRRSSSGVVDREWMTVRAATGQIEGVAGGGAGTSSGTNADGGPGSIPTGFVSPGPGEERIHLSEGGRHERVEWEEMWHDGLGQIQRTFAWEGPVMVSSWEAGPFTYPVEVPEPVLESYEGPVKVYRQEGRTHVVYGPWQVVIRGIGAHYSRQVLARWEVQRSWVAEEGHEVSGVRVVGRTGTGSSELVAMGASERRWRGESELRLGGASENFYVGASERRLLGASETLFRGASQWVARGASERRFVGASELRLRGASERLIGGASEKRLGGGSEHRLADRPTSAFKEAPPAAPGEYPELPQPSRTNG